MILVAATADSYCFLLETKIKNSLNALVRSGHQLTGCTWLLRRVISFARSRRAAEALAQAMQHQLKQPAINDQAHFIELLSCLKSMILFDGYDGNKASSDKVLGTYWEIGCIQRFLRQNPKIKMSDLGIADFRYIKEQAEKHMKELEGQLTYIAQKVNADDNGVNFAIRTSTIDGKTRILFAGYSNYNRATEFVKFKVENGGKGHFLTKKEWLDFINSKLVPKFMGLRKPKKTFDSSVEVDDRGQSFLDYSINKIKKEENDQV
jgi:hypothetical protein